MNNGWFPPPNNFIKINVHGASSDHPQQNGNTNGIAILARDEDGQFLWGIMGPLHEMNDFQSQLWAIHKGMKFAFQHDYSLVQMESDNTAAFNILLRQDPLEAELHGVTEAIQQINSLYVEFNKERDDPNDNKICRLTSVFATRNRSVSYMAYFAMLNCSYLVMVNNPFGNLQELLDLDIGLGPHLSAFEILLDLGLREVIQAPPPQRRSPSNTVEVDVNYLRLLEKRAFGLGIQESEYSEGDASSDDHYRLDLKNQIVSNSLFPRSAQGIIIREGSDQLPKRISSGVQESARDKGKGIMQPEGESHTMNSGKVSQFMELDGGSALAVFGGKSMGSVSGVKMEEKSKIQVGLWIFSFSSFDETR